MKSKLDGRPLFFLTLGVLSCLGAIALLLAYSHFQNPGDLYCGILFLTGGVVFFVCSNPLKK
jgi:membrane-bound ClpP family serine protease